MDVLILHLIFWLKFYAYIKVGKFTIVKKIKDNCKKYLNFNSIFNLFKKTKHITPIITKILQANLLRTVTKKIENEEEKKKKSESMCN